ncbi:MAG: hypothetical protein JW726_14905 [Anaerolineales bacterium]|nr:hypothetical protein [Anaerolineales bacterium]
MNVKVYREYLNQFVQDAIESSNGTNFSIAENLQARVIRRHFVRNREEQLRALADARKAFEEHRHWPLSLVLSHLGIEESPQSSGEG